MRKRIALLAATSALLVACSDDNSAVDDGSVGSPDAATVAVTDLVPMARPDAGPPPIAPAPWPTDHPLIVGAAEGLAEGPVMASADEARNVWVVSSTALYVLRAGETQLTRFTVADGLRDWPILSVAGGVEGEAFVGYQGVFGSDALTDPVDVRRSGDLDRVRLAKDGSLDVYHFDLHNSNTPTSGKYDETRIILTIVYAHDGPARGEVCVGSSHGATRIVGEDYADHRHPATSFTNADGSTSQHFGDMRGMALTPEGDLVVGNAFKVARLGWTPLLDDWWRSERNPWQWATHMWPSAETDHINVTGISVDQDGTTYVASLGEGLAVLPPDDFIPRFPSPPDPRLTAVAADPDGTAWLGSPSGLARYDRRTGAFAVYGGAHGLPDGRVRALYLDTTASPRALFVTTSDAVAIYRGQ